MIEDLAGDWRRLDERVESLSNEIEAIARQDAGCERLMSVPGIGPITSSAMVAAIRSGGGRSRLEAARLNLRSDQTAATVHAAVMAHVRSWHFSDMPRWPP